MAFPGWVALPDEAVYALKRRVDRRKRIGDTSIASRGTSYWELFINRQGSGVMATP